MEVQSVLHLARSGVSYNVGSLPIGEQDDVRERQEISRTASKAPNQTQQIDMIDPCYLAGPIKFYSLNAVDTAINRCGIEPLTSVRHIAIFDAI